MTIFQVTNKSPNNYIGGIQSKYEWAQYDITFAFPSNPRINLSAYSINASYAPLAEIAPNLTFRTYFRKAAATYNSISGLYLHSGSDASATIHVLTAQALTYQGTPKDGLTSDPGFVLRNATDSESYLLLDTTSPDMGHAPEKGAAGFGWTTVLHELGHALGLTHVDAWASTTDRTGDDVLDNNRYTVMSYEIGGIDQSNAVGYGCAVTPMAIDIAAIQSMYGTGSSNTGDTVYSLTDPGKTAIDVDGSDGKVSIGRAFYCIYDTGGTNDAIQYNGVSHAVLNLNYATLSKLDDDSYERILSDLTASNALGQFSGEIRADVADANYHFGGFFSRLIQGSSLAAAPDLGGYSIANGTIIEKAIGGNSSDLILGNEFDNVLLGQGGNDSIFAGDGSDSISGGTGSDDIYAGEGNDTLSGGVGADTLVGGPGDDTYVISSATDRIIELDGEGMDTLYSSVNYKLAPGVYVENMIAVGSAGLTDNDLAHFLQGDIGDNILNGAGGDDTIFGGAGRDTINGGTGSDSMYGGAGSDTYYIDSPNDFVYEMSDATSGDADTVIIQKSMTLKPFDNVEHYVLAPSVSNIYVSPDNQPAATPERLSFAANDKSNFISISDRENVVFDLTSGAGNDSLAINIDQDSVLDSGFTQFWLRDFDSTHDILDLSQFGIGFLSVGSSAQVTQQHGDLSASGFSGIWAGLMTDTFSSGVTDTSLVMDRFVPKDNGTSQASHLDVYFEFFANQVSLSSIKI